MSEEEVELTDILFDKGTLMDLYIGRWAALKKLQPKDMLLETDVIDRDAYYLGHKKLLPKKATETLVQLEGKARTALADRSIEFPVGGGRFVYYKALPELLKTLKALKEKWDVEVLQLVQDYPQLREQQLEALDKQAESIMKEELKKAQDQKEHEILQEKLLTWLDTQRKENNELYPSVELLKAKFPFEWRMFKVSALQGLEEMSTLDAAELQAAQDKLKADLQGWVKNAATEMHKVLGDAAAQAGKLLDKQGKLNPKNLKPLFEAFEYFRAIDFTGQSSFQKTIEKVQADFGVEKNGSIDYELTAEKLNYSDYAKTNLKELLEKMASLAVEDVASQAGLHAIAQVGSFSRFVELD